MGNGNGVDRDEVGDETRQKGSVANDHKNWTREKINEISSFKFLVHSIRNLNIISPLLTIDSLVLM